MMQMGLVKEIFMTTTQYEIDDEFIVTNSFEWDGMKFKIGKRKFVEIK